MTILVFAAHPDDEVIGAGGTIAKLASQGEQVVSVIFSYGEGSDPTKEPEGLIQERVKESKKAGNILGTKEVIFLGLSDIKFTSDIAQPSTKKKVADILQRYKPDKIYTHNQDDLHPAHRETGKLVKQVLGELKLRADVQAFTISVPIKFVRRDSPRVYVDITKTFPLKLKALQAFRTQKHLLSFYFIPMVRLRAWLDGFKTRTRHAEQFSKW